MTLNGVIALILRNFTEFDRQRPITSQWLKIDLFPVILTETDPRSMQLHGLLGTAELLVLGSGQAVQPSPSTYFHGQYVK